MSNAGKLVEASTPRPNRSWRVLAVLALSLVVLLGVLGLSLSWVSLLVAMLIPPLPPLPEAMTQIQHESLYYGGDEWVYTSLIHPCEVMAFYESQTGASCVSTICTADSPSLRRDQVVATCRAEVPIASFVMRWQVEIRGGSQRAIHAELHLQRDMLWSGTAPNISGETP